jgi:phage portal protein BeeE
LSNALDNAFAKSSRMLDHARASLSTPALMGGSGRSAGSSILPMQGATADVRSAFKGWVFACVDAISKRLATRPIHVGRIHTNGLPNRSRAAQFATHESMPRAMKGMASVTEELLHHPVLDLLRDPSGLHTSFTLLYSFAAGLELNGKSFLWLTTASDGTRELWPLPAAWICGFKGASRREQWEVRPDGAAESFFIPASEVVYAFYADPFDPLGCVSPLQAALDAVSLDHEITASQIASFKEGFAPRFLLTAGRLPGMAGGEGQRPALSNAQRMQLTNAIRTAYAGTRRNEPLILDGLIEGVTRLDRSVAEMDFTASASAVKERILQTFGVSEIVLGAMENSNRAAALVAESLFISQKLAPACEVISLALTEWLGPAFAAPNERLVVWLEPPTAVDPELRLKEVDALARHGAITVDELRQSFGLGPADSDYLNGDRPPGQADGVAKAILNEVNGVLASYAGQAMLAGHGQRE